ncbi:hypothetical protein Pcac1_g25966 [Phytophthora cactorum]|nr:hypothetical protein Pcac1_g25966 [Phytophthora cactorum]
MTGSLLAPLPLSSPSPVRPVVPSYSVDSFSEFSTRTVNRASYSPTSASGPRSARAKEEDEELYRDLLSGENGAEANDKAPVGYKASTFIPQKPGTRRAPSSTENSNPRQHLVPVKPASPKSKLSTPFIPRLKLEELVKARPDDCDEDDNNNDSQRTSQRGSELKQVTEEDESCFDDRPSEDSGDKMDPRKAHVVPRNRGFNSSLGFTNNSQRSNNNDKLDQETLRFLEKLDLKAVLHTPRPDILSFYPGMAMAPTARSMASPHSKAPACSAKLTEDVYVENRPELEKGGAKQKNDVVFDEPLKVSRVGGVASRLAHMKSTYGTSPIVRKARRETIDRLANPISGHSSTLQALSPKQREKREAALTSRGPLSPISAAITVSCRRSTTLKKVKPPGTLLGELGRRVGDCEIPVPTLATSKRKVIKRHDPLLHKRRTITNTPVDVRGSPTNSFTKRKSKLALGSRSLMVRKEALKKKFQSGSGPTMRGGARKIGGSTFLTQRDDEEGVELIEDFVARNRGAAQASLIFRSGTRTPSRHAIPTLHTRTPTTTRSRPRPPQMHAGVSFARVSNGSKNTNQGRASSFIGAVLDNSPAKTIVEANASNDKLVQTPASRLDRASSVPESADKQKDVAELQRSVSVSETRAPLLPSVTFPPPAVKLPTVNQPRRWTAGSSVHNALLQCNVRNVRITPDHVAVYALATRVPSLTTAEITIERRFREFYVFAQHVCAMFPSSGLWNLFPPKTYCALRHQSTLTDGFLHRRKNGLEEFLHCALEKMVLGGEAQGTIAQWYLLRLFLNLQPGLAAAAPSKDRSLTAALYEFKRHARQYSGWMVNRKPGPCDTVFEKLADGFHMIKRVTTCHFPARAVFDMVTNRSVDNEMPGVSWAPFVESEEVFSRESEHTWTVRTAFKDSSWGRGKLQMISRKTWRVDESGTIAIVMIPADSAAWDDPRALGPNHGSRVDCILGGWLITPTPWEGSCSVTWLMQVNFGVCDPRAEFTGNQGRLASFLDRRCLHVWADEIVHLIQALERVYDPEHYRNHGALIVGPKTLS